MKNKNRKKSEQQRWNMENEHGFMQGDGSLHVDRRDSGHPRDRHYRSLHHLLSEYESKKE